MGADTRGIGMTSLRTRERLVQRLREEGITDQKVLDVICQIPRHLFIDEALASRAYEDTALPIGYGQTISQPYIVALMTQALRADGILTKVLEIGTGSGYQTAVLASLVPRVYTVERIAALTHKARRLLLKLGLRNAHFKTGDGTAGWPEHGPYDGIIVTAAPSEIPRSLLDQLSLGGRLIIPVGGTSMQELLLVRRTEAGPTTERLELVNFVPLVKESP